MSDTDNTLPADMLQDERLRAIVLSDPDRYVVYRGGLVCDRHNGNRAIGADSSLNPHAITRSTARDMQRRRYDLAARAAAQGILDSVNSHGAPARGTLDAWRRIIQHQADIALTAGGRTSTDAAYLVGRAAGYLGGERDRRDDSGSGSGDSTITLTGQAADKLLDAIARVMEQRNRDGFDNWELSKP